MKMPVNDALVAEYTRRLRAGGPIGEVFPYPLSECDFTEAQQFLIRDARKARKQHQKQSKPLTASPPQPLPKTVTPKAAVPVQLPAPKSPSLTKLERMLYLQQGQCFFCGETLAPVDASIEHLHPLSLGGQRTEDNEVVCHKALNHTFGNLPLKRKFDFVLKAARPFRCPRM